MTLKSIHPWGDFEIDDASGLPQLAEGEFFRVANHLGYEIHLRRKTWYGSRKLEWTVTRLNKKSILEDAAYLVWKRDQKKKEIGLLGDYPPNSL